MRGRVVSCHGLDSGPHGRKFHAMPDAGFDVVAPDCGRADLATRVDTITQKIVADGEVRVLVGSSFGGMVAVLASIRAQQLGATVPGVVLCAPALAVRSLDVIIAAIDALVGHGRPE